MKRKEGSESGDGQEKGRGRRRSTFGLGKAARGRVTGQPEKKE
jgi:hypothetical protein